MRPQRSASLGPKSTNGLPPTRSNELKIQQQDKIEIYYKQFNSLQAKFDSFLRIYTNTDGMTFTSVDWAPIQGPSLRPSFQEDLNIQWQTKDKPIQYKIQKKNLQNTEGMYIDQFIVNDKGKIITKIAQIIKVPTSKAKKTMEDNQKKLSDIADKIKNIKTDILKKRLLISLIQQRKQMQKYKKQIKKQDNQSFNVAGIGSLTLNQNQIVQQTFREQILPQLENGKIIENCQAEITKTMKTLQQDESSFAKLQVDRKFHEENIKDLKEKINKFEDWISKASTFEKQYEQLHNQYETIRYQELEDWKQHLIANQQKKKVKLHQLYDNSFLYSPQFIQMVEEKNKKLSNFVTKLKNYNNETTYQLKQAQFIDKELLQMDLNNIRIPLSLIEIERIYTDVRAKINNLVDKLNKDKDVTQDQIEKSGKKAVYQEEIEQLEQSLQQLYGIQLNDIENQKAQFEETLSTLRQTLQLAMQGNNIAAYQRKEFTKKAQNLQAKVYQLRSLNKFIDPR